MKFAWEGGREGGREGSAGLHHLLDNDPASRVGNEDDGSVISITGIPSARQIPQEIPSMREDVILKAQRFSVHYKRMIPPDQDSRGGTGFRKKRQRPVELGVLPPRRIPATVDNIEFQLRG